MAIHTMVLVGQANDWLPDFVEKAKALKVGPGWEKDTDMGPLIRPAAKERVMGYIEKGINGGAKLELDGRTVSAPGYEKGNFLGPTIFSKLGDLGPYGKQVVEFHTQTKTVTARWPQDAASAGKVNTAITLK